MPEYHRMMMSWEKRRATGSASQAGRHRLRQSLLLHHGNGGRALGGQLIDDGPAHHNNGQEKDGAEQPLAPDAAVEKQGDEQGENNDNRQLQNGGQQKIEHPLDEINILEPYVLIIPPADEGGNPAGGGDVHLAEGIIEGGQQGPRHKNRDAREPGQQEEIGEIVRPAVSPLTETGPAFHG